MTPLGKVILRRKNEPERQVVRASPPPLPKAKAAPPTVAKKPHPKAAKAAPPPAAKKPHPKAAKAGPVWHEGMTRAELGKVATAAGLPVKYRTKKDEIITMLKGIK